MSPTSTPVPPLKDESLIPVDNHSAHSQGPQPTEAYLFKIRRRIDLRVFPWMCSVNLVAGVNMYVIANAAILNLEKGHDIKHQLDLSPSQWNWVIACFYFSFAFSEPIIACWMHGTRPSLWLSIATILWGVIALSMSAVQSYGGLVACRTLLGIAEAAFYPYSLYYLTIWYKPKELATRVALIYACACLSGFTGGFLSFAASFADGRLAGWRWLFIVGGAPAILMGVWAFLLPDCPQKAKFLEEGERIAMINHLSDRVPSRVAPTRAQIYALLATPTFWAFSSMWLCHYLGGLGLSFVLPTVIHQLGFTTTALSNVLTMPPSLLAFVVLISLGWSIQRRDWNPYQVGMAMEVVTIVCYIIQLTVHVAAVRYLALTVATASSSAIVPVMWPARLKSVREAPTMGLVIGLSGFCVTLSGVISPTIFSTIYGPDYRVSFIVCTALLVGALISIALAGFLEGELTWSKRPDEGAENLGFSKP